MKELWVVEFSAFPLTWHIAYNTTACCYRTSRDLPVVCRHAPIGPCRV